MFQSPSKLAIFAISMKNWYYIVFVVLMSFNSCVTQEGVTSISQSGKFKITTIQLRGAAFSSPIQIGYNSVVLGTHRSSIYFLTPDSIMNMFRTKFWVHATPAIVYDSLVTIGSYDGNMYFFNEKGELQKKLNPGGRIFTNPVQLDSLWMVFATGLKGLCYYNIFTDSLFTSKISRLTHGSPTVLGNKRVCVGSNDKTLYFFDELGNKLSSFKTGGWIMHSKPMVQSDSVVVVGSYDNNIYSVSSSGRKLWSFETNGKIHASPQQFSNGNIICGSFDKNIYVLNKDGQIVNYVETGNKVISSAAIINGKYAVVGSYDGYLYVIDAEGKVLDTIPIGGKVFSSPISLDDGSIFCATMNGRALFIRMADYSAPSSQKL